MEKIILSTILSTFVFALLNVEATEYFDLSYSINKDTIYYPGQKVEFELSKDKHNYTESGMWYATYSFCMGEHGGTHIDAPIHFSHDGWTLDEIPPSRFIDVPATVIDIEKQVFEIESERERGGIGGNLFVHDQDRFMLRVQDIIEHEKVHGPIPFKGIVLVHTGWGRHWTDKVKYLGWRNSSSGSRPTLRFPGCSEKAAKWLANERGIVGFGIDTPSVDVGESTDYPVHVLFAKRQIYNIENVANLHLVIKAMNKSSKVNPEEPCNLHLFVLPIKITSGTGAPASVLAYCKQ